MSSGEYRLQLDVGSRQWGGRKFDLDFDLGGFNEEEGDFGNAWLFSVVSIWNTGTCSCSSWPIRQALECRALALWSMNERECRIVRGLW